MTREKRRDTNDAIDGYLHQARASLGRARDLLLELGDHDAAEDVRRAANIAGGPHARIRARVLSSSRRLERAKNSP